MPDVKFIPDSDTDFKLMACNFATAIASEPQRFFLSQSDSELITRAVAKFQDAMLVMGDPSGKNKMTVMRKDAVRAQAEKIIRKYANIIRPDERISAADKITVGVRERPRKLRSRKCPMNAPWLQFVGSREGTAPHRGTGAGSGAHVLKFRAVGENAVTHRAKPEGVVRLELFVDLVPPGEPVPQSPIDRVRMGRGWPWYLRSYTKSPIEVEFPMPGQPMLVVYWARWADARGNVSRFSATCVARVEGWTASMPALPETTVQLLPAVEPKRITHQAPHVTRCMIVQLPGAVGGYLEAEEEIVPQARMLSD